MLVSLDTHAVPWSQLWRIVAVGFGVWLFVFWSIGLTSSSADEDLYHPPRPMPSPNVETVQGIPFNARLRTGWSRGADGREPYTEFSCEAFTGMARVVIASPAWAHRGRTHPTMAPLDVAAWPYAVTTNDAAFAVRTLDFETRRLIEDVDALHEGALLVDLRPGALLIRAAGVKSREATLEFAQKAAAVAARLRGAIKEELSIDAGAGTCRVCGVALSGATVSCGKCSTPHHRECWDYNGGCSVYACGSRAAAS